MKNFSQKTTRLAYYRCPKCQGGMFTKVQENLCGTYPYMIWKCEDCSFQGSEDDFLFQPPQGLFQPRKERKYGKQ